MTSTRATLPTICAMRGLVSVFWKYDDDALLQVARLADVHDFAGGIHMPVDARQMRQVSQERFEIEVFGHAGNGGRPAGHSSRRPDSAASGDGCVRWIRARKRGSGGRAIRRPGRAVAHQDHIAAGAQGGPGAREDVAGDRGAFHGQIIGEHHTIVAHAAAQDILDPAAREASRLVVDLGIDDVGRHNGRQDDIAQPAIGRGVLAQDALQAARIHRDFVVRIRADETMSREMLAAGDHAGQRQPLDERARQHGDHARIAMKGTIADDLADTVIQVRTGVKLRSTPQARSSAART